MKSKKKQKDFSNLIRFAIALITVFIITLFFPKSETIESEINIGDIWSSKDLISQFSFPILKYPDEYERDLKSAEERVLPIFELRDTIPRFAIDNLSHFLSELKKHFSLLSQNKIHPDSILRYYSLKIDTNQIQSLIRKVNDKFYSDFDFLIKNFIDFVYSQGYLNKRKDEISKDSIFLRIGNRETKYSKQSFLDEKDIENYLIETITQLENFKELFDPIFRLYVDNFILPNIIYNENDTKLAIEEAKYKVSKNIGIVLANERIVAKHQRITEDIKRKIDSYRRLKFERGERINEFLQFIGKFLHIFAILSIFSIYLYLFRKKVFNNTSRIIIISIILILISFFAYLFSKIETDLPIEFLVFVPVASMIITIIFDSRMGFYVTVILSLIIGGIRGNDYTIATANFIAGALSVYSVRDIKNRSQIFRSLLFILAGYTISIIAFGLERYSTLTEMGNQLIFAIANSIISPVMTYGMLIFFEKIFKVVTDLTLLELANFNHPLLIELRTKAPGTFHHSVNISILSESAAEAIGANSILTKVGALYHDIGKIIQPEYFIENLRDEKSEHEDLDPEQSAQIILNHVEIGIDLARKYALPEEVIDFIPMHHGTTQVQYFLRVAKKLGKKVDEDKFRYPGPKPKSKETGIVMLADAVESISRNLEVINENIFEDMIDEIIRKRFFDGELDDSNLTLRDLIKIKKSFINTLLGIYHQRIEYPES